MVKSRFRMQARNVPHITEARSEHGIFKKSVQSLYIKVIPARRLQLVLKRIAEYEREPFPIEGQHQRQRRQGDRQHRPVQRIFPVIYCNRYKSGGDYDYCEYQRSPGVRVHHARELYAGKKRVRHDQLPRFAHKIEVERHAHHQHGGVHVAVAPAESGHVSVGGNIYAVGIRSAYHRNRLRCGEYAPYRHYRGGIIAQPAFGLSVQFHEEIYSERRHADIKHVDKSRHAVLCRGREQSAQRHRDHKQRHGKQI